jgi:drug/metabolite transporter (DMT)-like permease
MPGTADDLQMSSSKKGYFYSIIAAVFSGASIGIGKYILIEGDPVTMALGLFACAVPVNYLWWRFECRSDLRIRLRAGQYLLIFCQAAFSFTAIVTLWIAVKMMDPTIASFLSRFEVLVVVLIGLILFKERFKKMEAVGAIIVFAGLFIIRYRAGIEVTSGMVIIIASATIFGISEAIAKVIVREVEPALLALFRNILILLFLIIYTAITGKMAYSLLGPFHYLVPFAALLGPALGRPVYLHALKHLDMSKVATVNQAQPIAVAVITYFLIGTLPGIKDWIGGTAIICGCVMMIHWSGRRKSLS